MSGRVYTQTLSVWCWKKGKSFLPAGEGLQLRLHAVHACRRTPICTQSAQCFERRRQKEPVHVHSSVILGLGLEQQQQQQQQQQQAGRVSQWAHMRHPCTLHPCTLYGCTASLPWSSRNVSADHRSRACSGPFIQAVTGAVLAAAPTQGLHLADQPCLSICPIKYCHCHVSSSSLRQIPRACACACVHTRASTHARTLVPRKYPEYATQTNANTHTFTTLRALCWVASPCMHAGVSMSVRLLPAPCCLALS